MARTHFPPNIFRICIDRKQNDIEGRAFTPLADEAIAFNGLGNLILKMDLIFDKSGYPQSYQDKRSFGREKTAGNSYRGVPKSVLDDAVIAEQSGEVLTCDVLVKSRMNTSWQGYVFDGEGERVGEFSGEIELIEQILKLSLD